MLWYKSWLETRWRFVIGLALLICSAVASVLAYPELMKLMPLVPKPEIGGELGRRITEAAELVSEYRGYVWSQWFTKNLSNLWILFAALLGTGGLVSQTSGGAALFTLSLPVSRSRLLGVRAATGLAELFVMALIPSLIVPLLSPAVGESYGIADTMVHALCLFVAGAVFFSLAFALSTVFADVWRPALLALVIAGGLSVFEQIFRDLSQLGVFHTMSAESYFRRGELPWPGLLISVTASAAMLYGAAVNIQTRDF